MSAGGASSAGGDADAADAADAAEAREEAATGTLEPPPAGTVERWAWDYVLTTDLAHKQHPPPLPQHWEEAPPPRRLNRPGRPEALQITARAPKSPGPEAIRVPLRRAQLVHTFLHHELQAAELMCWALLAFPDTPRAFRRGLLQIAGDELRHMGMYADYLATLGYRFGDFPVRDWFWQRVPSAASPAAFTATLGMGLEGGNLDHAARFAARFRAIGDEAGAAMQDQVCAEEIPHVHFAVHWFQRFMQQASPDTRSDGFDTWTAHLPPPLSPLVMRGEPLNREYRARAGFSEAFLDALAAWSPKAPGC
ncbi:ferritin-like domain-containing protein [Chondromyces apiculatus]|uniref:Uncharacterized protein n=1 Tax=Chondromyces apiculatus DSM 436 TaxID=1192034 RepID=A0A017T7D0_9BACT|nr:DUF455 family protein [Chondromyces apiculatus]EYF04907.1 Hypothetical protein CAP_3718 [Chondromyces apiculatus DSM 436]